MIPHSQFPILELPIVCGLNTPFLEENEELEEKICCNTAYLALQTSLSFLEKQLDVTSLNFSQKHNLFYVHLSTMYYFEVVFLLLMYIISM